jgi:hypothetical protein
MEFQDKAKLARRYFTKGTRGSSDVEFWKKTDDVPDWVEEMIHAAHTMGGGHFMLPDDWRYEQIVAALESFIHEDREEVISCLEADHATSDLTAWLASDNRRLELCDEATDEYGLEVDAGMMQRLQFGQLYEKSMVYNEVADFLENQEIEEELAS